MTREYTGVIEAIKRTRTQRGREAGGLFAIEGTRLHERALRSGHPPREAVISETFEADGGARSALLLAELRAAGCLVFKAPDAALVAMTEGRGLGDIVGLVPLHALASLEAVPGDIAASRDPIVVAVDIFDPGNCGALVRTALAGGAALFVAAGQTDPFHPRAVQTSMGSLFKMPIVQVRDAVAALEQLRASGVRCVGMSCDAEVDLPEADLDQERVAIVLGSEAHGLNAAVSARLDLNVRIPMPPGVDSFSVNAAAAIALYEIMRSR